MSASVSIILPFHNQEAFLGAAIASVQAQTLDSWELLLVDDGSTDDSPAIARAYAAADPARIRLLHHPDRGRHGAAAARNLGLREARGEFVGFLDGDDLYEPFKLALEVALLRSCEAAAMLYGPTLWWYPEAGDRVRPERLGLEPGRLYPPPELAARILLSHEGAVPCTCAVLIRRVVALEVGGFEEGFRLYEDQTLWAKLFLRYPILISSRPTSRYRQHAGSTSAQALRAGEYHCWRLHDAEAHFFEWFASYVARRDIADPSLARALARAQAPYRRRSAALYRTARALVRQAKSTIAVRLLRRNNDFSGGTATEDEAGGRPWT